MSELQRLIASYAQPGRLDAIILRPARRAAVMTVPSAQITQTGLDGDHGSSAKRAVTLIQAEHLAVIGAMLGRAAVSQLSLRRNLVVSGLNLNALKGRRLTIGDVVIEITGICAPCSRMEEALGQGGYSAMRGHGGWCAAVVCPGRFDVGDAVTPM